MRKLAVIIITALASLAAQVAVVASSVELQALLGDTAVLLINGERKTLRAGGSHAGVTLLETTTTTAILEINGQRQSVGLSQRVGTTFSKPEETVVTIARNEHMQYLTGATINGANTRVLVDTGANTIAISSAQARGLNIPYGTAEAVMVQTASGLTEAYPVTLGSVSVGGIEVDNVPAVVVSGSFPAITLLGMSYLRHVKIEENNGILSLSR